MEPEAIFYTNLMRIYQLPELKRLDESTMSMLAIKVLKKDWNEPREILGKFYLVLVAFQEAILWRGHANGSCNKLSEQMLTIGWSSLSAMEMVLVGLESSTVGNLHKKMWESKFGGRKAAVDYWFPETEKMLLHSVLHATSLTFQYWSYYKANIPSHAKSLLHRIIIKSQLLATDHRNDPLVLNELATLRRI